MEVSDYVANSARRGLEWHAETQVNRLDNEAKAKYTRFKL